MLSEVLDEAHKIKNSAGRVREALDHMEFNFRSRITLALAKTRTVDIDVRAVRHRGVHRCIRALLDTL